MRSARQRSPGPAVMATSRSSTREDTGPDCPLGNPTTAMNVFKQLEEMLAGLVEGTFGRVFRSEVQPIQIAHKLGREMLEHRTVSVSRVYVPNEYVVYLSPQDRERYAEVEDEVIDELGAYLLEQARREQVSLASRPLISFQTDEELSLGEFGIQARLVRADEESGGDLEQGEHGHTMI